MENKLVKFLSENYPSLVNEHDDGTYEVNFNKLKEELNDVNISDETYGINWLGKSYARVLRDYPVKTLIEPDKEHNNQEENKNSNNVYIEGDNLEVLKHLKNAYSNKIKMIYIDPPYNTGSDGFVYNDKFNFSVEDFMNLANVDEEEAKKILDYTTSKRSSHSAWLTFMYPRLYIARELLTDDGVIFISIDDNEQAQLKLLCDEIFGENNFICEFTRQTKKGGKSSSNVMINHEYLICYSKNIDNIKFNLIDYDEKNLKKFIYQDKIGKYALTQTLDYNSLKYSKNMDYEIIFNGDKYYPGGKKNFENRKKGIVNKNDWVWRWNKDRVATAIKQNLIVEKNDRLYTKQYLNYKIEGKGNDIELIECYPGKKCNSLMFIDNKYSNDTVKKYMKLLFNEELFPYAKPLNFISELIKLVTNNNDIILDFFSGSATTADAVMSLNAEYNSNRKFIMIQISEKIDTEQIGAYNFCDKLNKEPLIPTIAKERIKRASKKIKEENQDKEYINDLDFGFKVYKTIDDERTKLSEIKELDINQTLMLETNNLDALLSSWMLYDGYDLNTKINEFMIDDYKGYLIDTTLYLLDKNFSTNNLKSLVEKLNEKDTPIINRVVLNEVNFTNKLLAEINEQIFDKNIKEVNINIIKRI